MKTPTTNELLFKNGFQGYVNEDEGYFRYNRINLYCDDGEKFAWAGTKLSHKYFEDIIKEYEKLTGIKFVPKKPLKDKWLPDLGYRRRLNGVNSHL